MRVNNADADYLGLGPDTGIGSDRYRFLDKPHQFVRELLNDRSGMRGLIDTIERMIGSTTPQNDIDAISTTIAKWREESK